MKTAGIVSEFNPFHNGHKYLIDSVRAQHSPDAVVCIMSGDFVQRGGPAVLSKWDRAAMAVACGADLVVELPAVYAVSGASHFAKGAVRIMKGLGLDIIAFGSESGSLIELESKLHDGELTPMDIKNRPNDILALEYIKQNAVQNAGLQEYTVLRVGAGHDSGKIVQNSASASFIRKMLSESGKSAEIDGFMPSEALDILRSSCLCIKEAEARWFDLIRWALLDKCPEEISALPAAYGGIEYRLKEAVLKASSLDELILSAKAKRYAYAGLSRLVTQLILGISRETVLQADEACLAYARVLAFSRAGSALLKEKRKSASIPVITNIGKNLEAGAPQRLLLDIDTKAADIYSILLNQSIYQNSDYVRHP